MDITRNRTEGADDHIWLRYATQFPLGGRTYTVEVGIPMPVGASAEVRAQLIQEAEAGMDQLAGHVENRVAQMLKRTPTGQSNLPAPSVPATPKPVNKPAAVAAPQTAPPQPVNRPAAAAAPQTGPQPMANVPVNAREEQSVAQGNEQPAARPVSSASMPLASTYSNDAVGNLKVPQFVQHIREEMGLNPKQAMELLRVKSLDPGTGINLREALERLRYLVAHGTDDATKVEQRESGSSEERSAKPGDSHDISSMTTSAIPIIMSASRPSPSAPLPPRNTTEVNADSVKAVHDEHPIYIFDEEEGGSEEGDDLLADELEGLDQPPSLTMQERVRARNLVSKLRESRGATVANNGRLNALNNVAGSQISEEQQLALIEGVWGVTALKKLKVDQVEMLISWAKEDDFVNEVEIVLTLLEEEQYARGNR